MFAGKEVRFPSGCEPTYKELKQGCKGVGGRWSTGCEPTYKELKL